MRKICLIGGINYATIVNTEFMENENSIPSNIHSRFGGVSFNIASKLIENNDGQISIVSVISKDALGKLFMSKLDEIGIQYTNSIFIDSWSSYYCHINIKGNSYGFDDMGCLRKITPEYIELIKDELEKNDLIFIDGNIEESTISFIVNNLSVPIFFDGTSPEKSVRIKNFINKVDVIKLNYYEFCKVFNIKSNKQLSNEEIIEVLSKEKEINKIIVTLGKNGAISFSKNNTAFYKPKEIINTSNPLRAGDAFVSGLIRGFIDELSDIEMLKEGSIRSINVLKQNIIDSKNKI